MGLLSWLNPPLPAPPTAEHTLADIIIADAIGQPQAKIKALSVAAVYRARQLNADTPASLDVKVGDSLVPAPNADQTTQDFIVEAVLALQDHGELYVGFSDGDMWVVPNDEMQVKWDSTHRFRRYENKRTGVKYRVGGVLPNLYVVSLNRPAGALTGTGWMQSERIKGLIAEQKWSQEYFENSGNPTGILSAPGVLTKKEADSLREQWINARYVRAPAVITAGMEWKSTSFSATDSEWTQTHLVGIGDVAALSGVPAHFLAYSPPGSTLTYQNTSDLWHVYWSQTLKVTYVSRLERMWTFMLRQQVKFDPEPLLVASMKDRVWAATELVRTGFDPTEALDQVGMPPIPHTGEVPVTLQQEATRNAP